MPTGKVCCLHCYLASLYKRSLQTNSVFQLVCIRGDKCTSGTHDQWVRVRSIVYNLEKKYHDIHDPYVIRYVLRDLRILRQIAYCVF